MRLLANENFPGAAVEGLRKDGHDVMWVRTECPGVGDQTVLALAQSEGRIVLTFDKDFGELAFRAGLSANSGVILFRLPMATPGMASRLAIAILRKPLLWNGHFTGVEGSRIRTKPLPAS